ncbi:MAG: chemotaxis protein CheB [Verrucomicrobiaceae bacterium]|nr:MAG: chemotaxis protein CheB [Verrucomicrobiaceae bacterium]
MSSSWATQQFWFEEWHPECKTLAMIQESNQSGSLSPASFQGRVIVIGASAGGTEAVEQLVAGLAPDIRAAVLIVRHLPAETPASFLVRRLRSRTTIPCLEAKEGAELLSAHVVIAPSDNHLLVDGSRTRVVHGPRENRWRPSVDTLFRSAAVSHGSRVIGVILSGMLDDGTAGMSAIKSCGGICVVQDPEEAAYPDMPRNVLNNVTVDHCAPVAEIASLLGRLVDERVPAAEPLPPDILVEDRIARSAVSDMDAVEELGERSVLTCPDCGGVLWRLSNDGFPRFRCHTGHVYSPEQLEAAADVNFPLADRAEQL